MARAASRYEVKTRFRIEQGSTNQLGNKFMATRASETTRMIETAGAVSAAAAPKPHVGKQDRHFVTALSRGLDVLSCFRSGSRLLGNQDISERCRLPKSTVSRLTYTLTKLGYLHYVKESGKYRLGTATLALGSAVLGRFEVRDLARPLMQELADSTGTSVALGARQRLSMVCVEVCKGNAVLSLNMEVGMRLPLATSAIGRAYLCRLQRHRARRPARSIERAGPPRVAGLEAGHRQGAGHVFGPGRVQPRSANGSRM